jgi:hypothetical protein
MEMQGCKIALKTLKSKESSAFQNVDVIILWSELLYELRKITAHDDHGARNKAEKRGKNRAKERRAVLAFLCGEP